MNDTDIKDLLVTYGDALVASYPMPLDHHRSGLPSRPAPALTRKPEELRTVENVFVTTPEQRRWHPGTVLALAASLIVLCVVLVTSINTDEPLNTAGPAPSDDLVLPGEIVLRTDPLVVIAPHAPNIGFDTTGLGERVTYENVRALTPAELDVAIDQAIERIARPHSPQLKFDVRKVTLLWTNQGELYAVGASEATVDATWGETYAPPGTALRFWTTVDGRSSTGDFEEITATNADDLSLPDSITEHIARLEARETSMPDRYPSVAGFAGGGHFTIHLELAAEVAVVQLITEDGAATWMTPVDGRAALSGEGEAFTQIELVTYNSDGEELTRRLATAEGG